MGYETVIYEKRDGIARITLNRPERMNAFNAQLVMDLVETIGDAAMDDAVRVLILTGAGKGFCAGADFRYTQVRGGEVAPEEAEERGTVFEEGRLLHPVTQGVILALQKLDKPTIAMVNGAAVGGGFDIALACDMRIGSENTRFMVAFTRIGIVPGSGGAWMLPRVVGLPKACELIFTGNFVEAEEAHQIGLLNRLVPADKLEEETMALAQRIAQGPPIALRLDKMMIYKGLGTDLETALAFASACESITLHSQDHVEGVTAFAQRRQPQFKGR
jgi:enoyl-CoA hydratase/carnithine racemase